ncbi:MAG: Nif11-like leader peptide family natural product precursor [Selenomonas sp.]|nr:Nif11-like leader peptide family natural product precursor [Selenomonas sp.]
MAESEKFELTKEQKDLLEKFLDCETPEEIMAAARSVGVELSEEEAKACLEELEELSPEELKAIAGGGVLGDAFRTIGRLIKAVLHVKSAFKKIGEAFKDPVVKVVKRVD